MFTPLTVTKADDANNLADKLNRIGYGLRLTDSLNNWADGPLLARWKSAADSLANWLDAVVVANGQLKAVADTANNWADAALAAVYATLKVTPADSMLQLQDAPTLVFGYRKALTDTAANWNDAVATDLVAVGGGAVAASSAGRKVQRMRFPNLSNV